MVLEFWKKDITPWFQNAIKPIVLVVINQVQDRIQKQRIFQRHRITAVVITTLGFEHRRSVHKLRIFSRPSGRQEMGKSKQYLQTKIPEQ
jgi:hypothetical protein